MNLKEAMEIFETNEFIPLEALKKTHRTLAKKNHPDLASTMEERLIREEKMQKINAAYDILKNITDEDIKKITKQNNKKKMEHFFDDLKDLTYEKALEIQDFVIEFNISNEEIKKILNKFIKLRKKYYYEKTSPYFFKYHYRKIILPENEKKYLDYLCNNFMKKYLADILLEIDVVIKECVDIEMKKRNECLNEYFSIELFNYNESQKKYLEKILSMDLSSKDRKELFLKYSLIYQIEEEMIHFIACILRYFKQEDRTHARKQILGENLGKFIQNLIEKKVSNESLISTLPKNNIKLSIFDFLPSFLKTEINLFLKHIQLIFNQNNVSFSQEELEFCKKQLFMIMYAACKEKTIEPPKYVLRNERFSHKYQ